MAYGGDFQQAAGVREGEILGGKYRIERVLGAGGMGVVVAAHHLQLDEKVAIKLMLPEALGHPEAVARFLREARSAVKIKSEHVATVKDVGTLPNGAPYMVMEYLDGGDLAGWLKQRGPMPIEQAIEFVLQACVAVADAHALGIVHRDLKPANLFCIRRSDGQLAIKVLDFGISKLTDPSGMDPGSATRTSTLMGSPLYMSPEQMRSSRDVDARTDIWALGVILFELMVGRPPFKADTVTEIAIQVAGEPTPAIRSLRPEVPEELQAVVFKCLEKDRRARYRNVAELALALLPFGPKRAKASVERISGIVQAAGLSASALELPPSPQPQARTLVAPEPQTVAPVGRTAATPVRRKTAVLSLVGLCGVGVVAGAGILLAQRPAVSPAARPPHDVPEPTRAPPSSPAAIVSLPLPAVLPTQAAIASDLAGSPAPIGTANPVDAGANAQAPAAPPPGSHVATSNGMAREARATAAPALPAAAPQTPPAAHCNPPYTIDSAGHRQYKPECL